MSLLYIEFPPNCPPRHLKGSKEGRSWDFHMQAAYLSSSDPVPDKLDYRLPGDVPMPAGRYLFSGGALRLDKRSGSFALVQALPLVSVEAAIAELKALAAPAGVRLAG